jgi:hypothetical protein
MLIPVSCHTNLDECKGLSWPTSMYNPKVGDTVEAKCGRRLYIVGITHKQIFDNRYNYNNYPDGVYLSVELHRRGG